MCFTDTTVYFDRLIKTTSPWPHIEDQWNALRLQKVPVGRGWNQSQSESLISMHGHKNDATHSFKGNMRSVGMISNCCCCCCRGCLRCVCCCVTRVSHKAFVTMLTAMGATGSSWEQMRFPRNEHSVIDGECRSEENQTSNAFDHLRVRCLTSVKRHMMHEE